MKPFKKQTKKELLQSIEEIVSHIERYAIKNNISFNLEYDVYKWRKAFPKH